MKNLFNLKKSAKTTKTISKHVDVSNLAFTISKNLNWNEKYVCLMCENTRIYIPHPKGDVRIWDDGQKIHVNEKSFNSSSEVLKYLRAL